MVFLFLYQVFLKEAVPVIQRGTNAPDDSGPDLLRYLQVGGDQIPDLYLFTTPECSSGSGRERFFARGSRVAERCTLRDWDIILTVGGQAGKVGLFRQKGETPCIVGHQALILRYPYPDEEATSSAAITLYMYLKSEIGEKALQFLAQKDKHGVRSIKIDELLHMAVPSLTKALMEKAQEDFRRASATSEQVRELMVGVEKVRHKFFPPGEEAQFLTGEFWRRVSATSGKTSKGPSPQAGKKEIRHSSKAGKQEKRR